jgi:hypothetical protein
MSLRSNIIFFAVIFGMACMVFLIIGATHNMDGSPTSTGSSWEDYHRASLAKQTPASSTPEQAVSDSLDKAASDTQCPFTNRAELRTIGNPSLCRDITYGMCDNFDCWRELDSQCLLCADWNSRKGTK